MKPEEAETKADKLMREMFEREMKKAAAFVRALDMIGPSTREYLARRERK